MKATATFSVFARANMLKMKGKGKEEAWKEEEMKKKKKGKEKEKERNRKGQRTFEPYLINIIYIYTYIYYISICLSIYLYRHICFYVFGPVQESKMAHNRRNGLSIICFVFRHCAIFGPACGALMATLTPAIF